MLADPQSVTINAVATPLAKTQAGPNQNSFTSADGKVVMTTKQNTTAKRFRREVRISQTKIAADPISAVNAEAGTSVYIVIDEPRSGVFSDTEIGYLIDALKTWLSAANYNKVLGGEY
jgi:predicted transcriptional regulator